MVYCLKENRLKVIKNIDQSICPVVVSNEISQMIPLLTHSNAAFLLHRKNRWSLFWFAWYQFRAKTIKEFKIIIYAAPLDGFFYLLKFVSFVSFGRYKLIVWGRNLKCA
jgi:hypothetical protein